MFLAFDQNASYINYIYLSCGIHCVTITEVFLEASMFLAEEIFFKDNFEDVGQKPALPFPRLHTLQREESSSIIFTAASKLSEGR